MRIPSIQQLLQQANVVIKRFPAEIAVVIIGSCIAFGLTLDGNTQQQEYKWGKWLLTCFLTLPTFIAITTSAAYNNWGRIKTLMVYAIAIVALLVFRFTLHDGEPGEKEMMRFAMLNIAAHLFVSCAPFLSTGSSKAFWQYNRILFLRIITSAIFSGVLFLGLIGAMAAMNELFNLGLDEDWYLRIFILIAGTFNTIFFLYGVPASIEELESENTYPLILSIFTRFVLLPLVFIYFIILLAYEAKIAISWQLPNGWVSNLIIAFAIAGILSILLVHPLRNAPDHKWIRLFAKWFYLLMIPLIALMFVAIIKRLSDYGFTEERLIVMVTSGWLGFITLTFLLRPNSDIRIIPTSLALTAIVLQFFIFELSKKSQLNRLEFALQKNNLLKNGIAVKLDKNRKIPVTETDNIRSIAQYLASMHGRESLVPLLTPGIHNNNDEMGNSYSAYRMLDSLGYTNQSDIVEAVSVFDFDAHDQGVNVEDYDLLIELNERRINYVSKDWSINKKDNNLIVFKADKEIITLNAELLAFKILEQEELIRSNPGASETYRSTVVESEDYIFKIVLNSISSTENKPGERQIEQYSGFLLIKNKIIK